MHCGNPESPGAFKDSEASGKEKKRKSCSSLDVGEKTADGSLTSKKAKVECVTSVATSSKVDVSKVDVSESISNAPGKSGVSNNFTCPLHGQKIEVQWDIHQDDGTVKSLWWGATHIGLLEDHSVEDKKEKSTNMKGISNIDELKHRSKHEILYQASHGFESEKRLVAYIDEHILFDVVEQDYLYWRFEGKEWMPRVGISANEYVGHKPGYEKLVIMSAEDLVEDQHRFERDHQNGVSVEQLGLAAMNTLPHQQQVDGALAYRSFADNIKMKLALILESKGANYVVTKNDVETIIEELKKEQEDRRRM